MLLILNQITNDVFISNQTKIKTLKIENNILIDICSKISHNKNSIFLFFKHSYIAVVVKIDKSFIDHLNKTNNPLVEAILSLAQSLNFEVVAEGIETQEQLNILQATQCN